MLTAFLGTETDKLSRYNVTIPSIPQRTVLKRHLHVRMPSIQGPPAVKYVFEVPNRGRH